MMLRLLTVFFAICLSFNSFSQEVFIGKPTKNTSFKKALDAQFYDYDVYKLDINEIESYVKSQGEYTQLKLKLGQEYDWSLNLTPHDMRAADYVLTVQGQNGIETTTERPNDFFAGILGSDYTDNVVFTINKDYFSVTVESGDKTYYLEPVKYMSPNSPDDLFVVYESANVIPKKGNSCMALEVEEKVEQYKDLGKNDAEFVACKDVQIALAGDLAMFNKYGSVGAVNGHIITILMNVQNNYDNEFNDELNFVIATQFVVTNANPWNASTNPSAYLNSFTGWGNGGGFGVTYDVAACWTNVNFNGGTIGIAWLNGICNGNRYHVCQDFSSNMNLLRVLWAHELGHNFSCTHDPSGSNTIMAPAVNGSNSWSSQSVSQVNSYVPTRSCLTACQGVAPPAASFTATPSTGCAPLTVNCTDQSTNSPSNWSWTVSLNGQTVFTSSQQNPTFTFANPGCYTISLVASNGIGASAPFTQTITVNGTPNANFFWTNIGTTVVFTNLTTPNDPCLSPTTYTWNFGDGATSTEFEPTHTYANENTYNVTLTATNACGTSNFFTEVAAYFPPSANFTADPTSGCPVLQVDFVNTSSNNSLTANWNFEGGTPSTSSDFFPSIQYFTPGVYDVTLEVCNPAGCDLLVLPDYIEILEEPEADAGPTQLIDCNNPEVDLDGTASSQGNNYIYNWTTADGNIVSGANTLTPTVDAPGEYCLEVTDNSGENCIATSCVEVFEDLLTPTADAGPSMAIDCINSAVELDGTGSSQNGNFTYAWSGPSIVSGGNTLTPEVDLPGFYTITVTNDDNGCTETAETEVTDDMVAPIANAGDDVVIDCNNLEVDLDGTASSQGANISYSWSGPGIVTGANTMTPTVNATGLYVLIVTDNNNGCTEVSDAIVTDDFALPTSDAGPTMTVNCDETEVTLDGTGSSQGSNYTYSWSGPNVIAGGTTLTPLVGAAGTYTLVVTNTNNGCTEASDAIVDSDTDAPFASAGDDEELNCTVTSVTLDGSSSSQGNNFSYSWSGPSIVSGGNTLTPTVDASGTYTITVLNSDNGCTSTASAEVTGDNTVPTASAGPTQTLNCANSIVELDGNGSSQNGGETYSWSGPGIVSGGNTLTPTVNATGTYTITVTGANGCTETSDVEVDEDLTFPTANAGDDVVLACSATSIALNGTNSSQGNQYNYNWDGPNVISGGTTLEPTVGTTGTYTLTVTNTLNGCTSSSEVEVTSTPPPAANISAQTNVDCNSNSTGEATASVSGGMMPYTYEWSSGGTEATETGLSAGTYEVTVTDSDQCTAVAEVTITEPDPLDANASSTNLTSVGANDGTATAEPNGGTNGYSFEWDNDETTVSISGLAPGDYTVTVTDANGCTDEQTVTVEPFDCSPVGLTVAGADAQCNGASDGEVSASGTNGENPFTYEWSTGDMTATVTNLPAGTYQVTATDNNGCEVINEITIGEPTLLESNITSSTNVDCNGNTTGSATVASNGGTPGYTYQWSTGGTEATEMNMPAGTHTVVTTDENGCETTAEIIITEPDPLEANQTSTNESGVNANDGTATANPTGGTAGFSYIWSNGATTQTIENLSPGEYCVTVTDVNGCEDSGCITVNSFDCGAITSDFEVVQTSCNGTNDGEATVNMNGGTLPYSYEWSSGDVGQTATDLVAGEYEVTSTDDNGCVIISSIVVPEPEAVSVDVMTQTNVDCEGQANGSATVIADGGNGGFDFVWSDGTIGETIEEVSAGIYTVTATDVNDCEGTLEVEILTDEDNEAPVVLTQDVTVSLDDNGMFTLTTDLVDDGTSDNCELVNLSLDITELTCDQVGEITVTLSAEDASGNVGQELATVTVLDVTPPTMTCPDNIVTNNCASPIAYDVPTGEDLCGLVTVNLEEGLPSGSIFPTGATTVTWSGTDPSGNVTKCSFTVNVQSDLNAQTETVNPDCFGDETGTATALPDGGTAPYTYQWDDQGVQMTQTAVSLSAGTYNVVVTDNVGCIVAATVEVTQPDELVSVLDDLQNENGSNGDGSISITPTGGTGPNYTFNWTKDGEPFSTEEDLTNLSFGEYCVEITDENGCVTTTCYTVEMINNTTNPELEQFITVLPNPTNGLVNVNFKLNDARNVKVDWYDYIGRLLIESDQQIVTEKSMAFDLTDMATGIYLVRITVDEDVLVKRVVVE